MTLPNRHRTFMVAAVVALLATMFVTASPVAAAGRTCFGQRPTIFAQAGVTTYGTSGSDVIIGTSGADVIRGRGGDDLICSRGGADHVYGGSGRDWIKLGPGVDHASGGWGRDVIYGGRGKDVIRGNSGADFIFGGSGLDKCYGGRGVDSLSSCNEAPTVSSPSSLKASEKQMADLVQDLRASYGVRSLQVSASLSDVARNWSQRLPSGFFHNQNVGNQIPSGWTAWGENIAYNGSVDAAFQALVNSPGHLANMVNAGYTHMGIGVYESGGRVYVTQVFARY